MAAIISSKKYNAMAGNRTRINCLEGSYADHYTTIAWWFIMCLYINLLNVHKVKNYYYLFLLHSRIKHI